MFLALFVSFEKIQPKQQTLYIDNELSLYQQQAFVNAAISWNYKTNGCANLKVKRINDKFDKNAIIVTPVSENNPNVIYLDNFGGYTLAYYSKREYIPTIFVVNSRIENEIVNHVALHEVGHVLLINHIKDKKSLMSPSINKGKPFIGYYDLKEFYKKYSCL